MEGDLVSMHDVFGYVQTGIDANQVVEGYFRSTGLRPKCLSRLQIQGVNLPATLFREGRLQVAKNRGPGR
jgi:pilus assembly protein CpaF